MSENTYIPPIILNFETDIAVSAVIYYKEW